MSTTTHSFDASVESGPAKNRARGPKRFVRAAAVSIVFLAGLLVLLLAIDHRIGRGIQRRHGEGVIGLDVYEVVNDRAKRPDDRVTTIYLGDSVARQLFRCGREPSAHLRYLTTNQAISVAGQYYLLRDALRTFTNVRRVRLVYTPMSWQNDLRGPLARDYFCAFFHQLDQVREVFSVKGDLELSAAHAGRWLLPNLMAANSTSNLHLQPAGAEWIAPPPAESTPQSSGGDEPLLRASSYLVQQFTLPSPTDVERAPGAVPVSGVSRYFLDRIRDLCRQRGVELRVLPSPCLGSRTFASSPTPYGAPIWYLPLEDFRDAIHVKPQRLDAVRREFISRYELAGD